MLVQKISAKSALAPNLKKSVNGASKKLNQIQFTLSKNRYVAESMRNMNKVYCGSSTYAMGDCYNNPLPLDLYGC